MLLQVEYRFAIVLFLVTKTTEGAENGVFFQIKENIFSALEKKAFCGLARVLCFPVLFCV